MCQEDTEGEIKREQTQEQRTEKDSMYELSAKNDRLTWNGGRNREEELLANCYFNSMKLAMDNGIRSIAFPSISTGVYSFPVELAAKIAVHTVNRFLDEIRIVLIWWSGCYLILILNRCMNLRLIRYTTNKMTKGSFYVR